MQHGYDPYPEAIIRRTSNVLHVLVLLAAGLAVAPSTLVSQEAEQPRRWQVSAEFSFADQSGNRVLRMLTAGLDISHLQREQYRLDAAFRSRYGRSEGELIALSHGASLALDVRPTAAWTPFLFSDGERDEFKRLDLRLSSGGGAKYTFRRRPDGVTETSLSLALLHSHERIAPEAATPPPVRTESVHLARWSLRGRTSHELREGVTLRHTTFYQPLWDDLAGYLLRSDTGLKILLTERLALSVDYQLKRDARPPAGVEPDDRLLTTGLIIDF